MFFINFKILFVAKGNRKVLVKYRLFISITDDENNLRNAYE
jgi:hypothetical protein